MGRVVADHQQAQQLARAAEIQTALRGALPADATLRAMTSASAAVEAASTAKPSRARELDCLAQAIYFEARGESPRGQAAVATVIMNRVKNPRFPKTVCGVVYQGAARHNGCQFSFACDGAVERVVEQGAWQRARKVAARVLSGAVMADIGTATHFHTTGVSPDWGGRMLRVAQVGLHVFYRFNPHAAPSVRDDADDAPLLAAADAQPSLRLAAAVVVPGQDVGATATPAAVVGEAAKPAAKLPEAHTPPAGLAKADAPAPAKPADATPS